MKLPSVFNLAFRREQKVDPRSKSFKKQIEDLLTSYGLIDKIQNNLCSLELFWRTWEYYRSTKGDEETEKRNFGDDLMNILSNYGITDPEHQDALLSTYFDILNATAGIEK